MKLVSITKIGISKIKIDMVTYATLARWYDWDEDTLLGYLSNDMFMLVFFPKIHIKEEGRPFRITSGK